MLHYLLVFASFLLWLAFSKVCTLEPFDCLGLVQFTPSPYSFQNVVADLYYTLILYFLFVCYVLAYVPHFFLSIVSLSVESFVFCINAVYLFKFLHVLVQWLLFVWVGILTWIPYFCSLILEGDGSYLFTNYCVILTVSGFWQVFAWLLSVFSTVVYTIFRLSHCTLSHTLNSNLFLPALDLILRYSLNPYTLSFLEWYQFNNTYYKTNSSSVLYRELVLDALLLHPLLYSSSNFVTFIFFFVRLISIQISLLFILLSYWSDFISDNLFAHLHEISFTIRNYYLLVYSWLVEASELIPYIPDYHELVDVCINTQNLLNQLAFDEFSEVEEGFHFDKVGLDQVNLEISNVLTDVGYWYNRFFVRFNTSGAMFFTELLTRDIIGKVLLETLVYSPSSLSGWVLSDIRYLKVITGLTSLLMTLPTKSAFASDYAATFPSLFEINLLLLINHPIFITITTIWNSTLDFSFLKLVLDFFNRSLFFNYILVDITLLALYSLVLVFLLCIFQTSPLPLNVAKMLKGQLTSKFNSGFYFYKVREYFVY